MKLSNLLRGLLICLLISQFMPILPTSAIPISDESISPSVFSPEGNGINDTITITFDSTSGQSLYLNVFYNSTQLIRSDIQMTESPTGTYRATWNGKDDNESYVTGEGVYTIRATDQQGSGTGDAVGTVTVNLTRPSNPSLSIDGGESYTLSQNVTLTISATNADKMKVSNSANFSEATWENYATSKSWQLTENDGEKTVYINFKTTYGTNISTSDTITLDTNVNTPTLSINSGASTTNNLTVSLGITASDATYMKVDNDTDFSNMSDWITKVNTYSFNLPSGADGSRTVYLKVRDEAGNVKTTSDSITVDTQGPTSLSMSINSGASYTNNRTVTLTLSASGGPETIWLSNNGDSWQSYDYATSKTWELSESDGLKTVYYKASDSAGNNATQTTATITLDTVNPSQVTLSSPTSGATLSNQNPTFSWNNPNSNSSTRRFKIEILQSGNTVQSAYTNTSTTSYTADTLSEGSYSWRVTVYDMANNSATTSQRSLTITVDGLAIPSPRYPTSGAKVNDTTPRIQWAQVSGQGTINYDYKYGNSSTNLTNTGSTTNLYVDLTERNHGDAIYWAVRSRNTTTQSNYSSVKSFTIDTQAPLLHGLSINDGAVYITSRSATLSINTTGASWLKISENETFSGASWTAYSSTKSFTLSSGDGTKTVYFIAKDNAVGDEGSSDYANINATAQSDTIILDSTAPSISSLIPTSGSTTSTTTNLAIRATLADSTSGVNTSRVTLKVDGSTVTPTSLTNTSVRYTMSTASEGSHSINLTVYDEAGNVAYQNWSFTVESEEEEEDDDDGGDSPSGPSGGGLMPPLQTLTITEVSHSPTSPSSSDTVTITATITHSNDLSIAELYWNDGTLHSKELSNTSDTEYQSTIGPFEGGTTVSYYITAIDSTAQSSTSTEQSFSIEDTTGPSFTIISPAADSVISDTTPTIQVSYSDPTGIDTTSITLLIDGTDVTALATITESQLNYTPSSPQATGSHTILVSCSDLQANTESVSWSYTLQTTELIKTIPALQPGENTTISFDSSSTNIESIELTAATSIDSASISVYSSTEPPQGTETPQGTIYVYISINLSESELISEAIITFSIENAWLTEQGLDKNDVVMVHYHNGEWVELETELLIEYETQTFYTATTDGFSTFAICCQTHSEETSELPILLIGVAGIIVVIGLVAVVFYIRRQ